MRTYLVLFSALFIPFAVSAQIDPSAQAAQAAQQASEQARQAAQQATQQAMEANRQAVEAAQQSIQSMQDSAPLPACCVPMTAPPKFSLKAGKYKAPMTVKITDATRGAVIYYSTDGWTPTFNSPRYRGPITIDSTATLQAIAIAPYCARSVVTSAFYTIAGTSPNAAAIATSSYPEAANNSDLVPVPLVFAATITSKTASVGDKIPMILTQDVTLGNFVVPKGTPASVTVTQVDRTGIGGAPGTLSFEADNLRLPSGPIPLQGGASREGEAKLPTGAVLIPVVGPLAVLQHGSDAVITEGTPFIAYIDLGALSAKK